MKYYMDTVRLLTPVAAIALLAGCGQTDSAVPQAPSEPVAPAPAPVTRVVTPLPAAPAPKAPAAAPTAPVAAAVPTPSPKETIGGGTIAEPAVGPAPTQGVGGSGFVLVKNWNFGTGADSTIASYADLTGNFQYHDQFGTIGNGTNYGAVIVAPQADLALKHLKQPVEGADTGGKPIREFFPESMKTYLVPLRGANECAPTKHNVGCGSFQAKWKLPKGGSRLGHDVLWETRVRYVTPPYFWFAIWTCGNKWNKGAEIDVVESFGYDNGGGITNYDGRYWHAGIVGGKEDLPYGNWGATMKQQGVPKFDGTAWHTWTMLYKADDTITLYVDGIVVQTGFSHWTLGTKPDGEELDMSFIFDGGWGHTQVQSVNKPLPASAFDGTFYDWDYSRVYLRKATTP